MKRVTVTLVALVALALPLTVFAKASGDAAPAAQKDAIFATYEEGRQALIQASMPAVKTAAAKIASAADGAKQQKIADLATAFGNATDVKSARAAFAVLSDEVIRYRSTRNGEKPVVVYCGMEKKSWLQPGREIGNPYVGEGMRKCGEIKD